VTQLAHNCALLGIAVDPGRLYDRDEPMFHRWLEGLVDKVNATKRAQERQSRGGK
jgi:hypothetical protein